MIELNNITISLYWPYLRLKPIRMIKHFWQRRTRGFDDSDLWNLDDTIAKFVATRLWAFKELKCSYPSNLKSYEEWQGILERIAFAFKLLQKDAFERNEFEQKCIDDGLKLFVEYYENLWS